MASNPIYVVTTTTYNPAALARWIDANVSCARLRNFILYIDDLTIDCERLRDFLQSKCPSAEVHVYHSAQSSKLLTSKRQIENLNSARLIIPEGSWVASIDSDEVLWIQPRLRYASDHPLQDILDKNSNPIQLRFWPLEYALKSGESHDLIPFQATVKWGLPFGWKKPFLMRAVKWLAFNQNPLNNGGLFLANDFAKSVFKAHTRRRLHHHGYVSWAEGAEKLPVREVWTQDILLVHFDFIHPEQIVRKVNRVHEQLKAGIPRSKNRIDFVRGYKAAEARGPRHLVRYVNRLIYLKPWSRRLLSAFHLIDELQIEGMEHQPICLTFRFNSQIRSHQLLSQEISKGLRPTSEMLIDPSETPSEWFIQVGEGKLNRMESIKILFQELKFKSFLRLMFSGKLIN